jgi:hypothetical protein
LPGSFIARTKQSSSENSDATASLRWVVNVAIPQCRGIWLPSIAIVRIGTVWLTWSMSPPVGARSGNGRARRRHARRPITESDSVRRRRVRSNEYFASAFCLFAQTGSPVRTAMLVDPYVVPRSGGDGGFVAVGWASRTSRTFLASKAGVTGFWINATPLSSTPWRTMLSSV